MSESRSSSPLLALASLALAIGGMVDAGYLTYMELQGIVPPCSPNFQCDKVLSSPWASIGPVPLAALGLGFYVTMCALSALIVLEKDSITVAGWKFQLKAVLGMLGAWGIVFSGFLVFLMGVVIQGWCFYCLISAGISTLLGVVSLLIARGWWQARLHTVATE
jgi:uncharacterized membrane protein